MLRYQITQLAHTTLLFLSKTLWVDLTTSKLLKPHNCHKQMKSKSSNDNGSEIFLWFNSTNVIKWNKKKKTKKSKARRKIIKFNDCCWFYHFHLLRSICNKKNTIIIIVYIMLWQEKARTEKKNPEKKDLNNK